MTDEIMQALIQLKQSLLGKKAVVVEEVRLGEKSRDCRCFFTPGIEQYFSDSKITKFFKAKGNRSLDFLSFVGCDYQLRYDGDIEMLKRDYNAKMYEVDMAGDLCDVLLSENENVIRISVNWELRNNCEI